MTEKFQKYRWYFLALLFAATSFVWCVVYREDIHGVLTVAFLDVGQGDSIYIEAPNGNQILLDGGPDKKVLKSLGAVMPFYDRSIDLLALSHPHLDHFGGFLYILPRYSVGGFASSGTVHDTSEYKQLLGVLDLPAGQQDSKSIKRIVLERGEEIDMGSGVTLEVLLPDRDVEKTTPHDGVLVMRMNYGKTSIMLTGDMEERLENYLVALDSRGLESTVLKIGHHGSHTSTGRAFLGYVSPEYAVISSDGGKRYGHPHKETLDTISKFGVTVLRTDEDGTIIFKSDGEKISLAQ